MTAYVVSGGIAGERPGGRKLNVTFYRLEAEAGDEDEARDMVLSQISRLHSLTDADWCNEPQVEEVDR